MGDKLTLDSFDLDAIEIFQLFIVNVVYFLLEIF